MWALFLLVFLAVVLPNLPQLIQLFGVNTEYLGAVFFPTSRRIWLSVIYYPFLLFITGFGIVRKVTSPKLIIKLGHTDFNQERGIKYFHVHVVNLNWPRWFIFFRRNTATDVTARVIYRKRYTNMIEQDRRGRWASNPEPSHSIDLYYPTLQCTNILPSDSLRNAKFVSLDTGVVVKEQVVSTFVFNEDNYRYKDEFPKYEPHKLPIGDYEVDVIVQYSENTLCKTFILEVRDDLDKTTFVDL